MRARVLRKRASAEEGVVAVLTALLMVVLLTAVAFTIDLGRLRHEKQTLQNAVDLSSLAGAGLLPVRTPAEALAATQLATNVALANAPELAGAAPGSLQISYKCVVSDPNGNGGQDSSDLGFACGPATAGAWSNAATWTLKPNRASHVCDPNAGDTCNTIVVRASNIVQYYFAPVMGINQGSTGVVQGAACTGTCGNPAAPLDVVLVLDRTTSMSSADVAALKQGAQQVLTEYDPSQQFVGFVSLPYGQTNNKCNVNGTQNYPTAGGGSPANPTNTWMGYPITNNTGNQGYRHLANGTLDTTSPLWQAINCLTEGNTPTINVTGQAGNQSNRGQTDLGDPLDAAQWMLANQGRQGVPKVVIFETDGQANQPYGYNPCNYLNQQATQAKNAGDTIYTIAYFHDPTVKCVNDSTGFFVGKYATTNLAMAATNSTDDLPGGCAATENTDGDNYFCTPSPAQLQNVFRTVAQTSVKKSRLLDV
ncbi:MAG TPA: TadE/TadG family type IV pilus assembly protein [Actinomycetota bacterium]|nr:TadE/TadG family type IV pilus assembly protein [Actinomycetota bacterium]